MMHVEYERKPPPVLPPPNVAVLAILLELLTVYPLEHATTQSVSAEFHLKGRRRSAVPVHLSIRVEVIIGPFLAIEYAPSHTS
jgi:hypothetical protein